MPPLATRQIRQKSKKYISLSIIDFSIDGRNPNYAFGPAGFPSSPRIGLNSYPFPPPSPNTLPSQDEVDPSYPDPYRPYTSKYKAPPSPNLEVSTWETSIPTSQYTHSRGISATSARLQEIRGERAEREKELERENLEDPYRRGRSGPGVSNENPFPAPSGSMGEQPEHSRIFQNTSKNLPELTVVVPSWKSSIPLSAATPLNSSPGHFPSYSTGSSQQISYRRHRDPSYSDPYRPYSSSASHYPQQLNRRGEQMEETSFDDDEGDESPLAFAQINRTSDFDGGGKLIQRPETPSLPVAGSASRQNRTESASWSLPQRPELALVSSTDPENLPYRRTTKSTLPGANVINPSKSMPSAGRQSATARDNGFIPNGYIDNEGRATHYRPDGLVGNTWEERRARRSSLIQSGKTVFHVSDEISKEKNAAAAPTTSDVGDDDVVLGKLKKEKGEKGESEDDEEEFGKKRKKSAYCARCCRPRVCVFVTFLVLLSLTVAGYIVWPHQPGILYLSMDETPGGSTLKTQGDADASSPVQFTADWTANFRATSNSQIGWDLGTMDVQVTTGGKKIGTGSLPSPVSIPAHSTGTLVAIPLQISYLASSKDEVVAAAIRSACSSQTVFGSDGKPDARPAISMRFLLNAKMGSGPVLEVLMNLFGLGRFEVGLNEQVACPKNSTVK